jgi:FAD:protein FMN transferase
MRKFPILFRIALIGVLASQTGRALTGKTPTLYTTAHSAMGTGFTLFLYDTDARHAAAVSQEVFEEVDRIENLLSNYREGSELSRIVREAAAAPVTTDPEMFRFLEESESWSRNSGGAFDITVGRLMKTWGFFRHDGRIPSEEELQALRSVTGWEKVKLDAAARTVRFSGPGIELDPGGIGKGFAVDAAVRILRADHVVSAMLSAGSSTIYGLGAPPHRKGWRVVISGPLPSQRTLSMITLRDTSLSSADCSHKSFAQDGHVYCHIMDPRTMHPVEGRIQVSIVDPSATASDALSNVLFVDPPKKSFAVLRQFAPEAEAIVVSEEGDRARCATYRWQGGDKIQSDCKH